MISCRHRVISKSLRKGALSYAAMLSFSVMSVISLDAGVSHAAPVSVSSADKSGYSLLSLREIHPTAVATTKSAAKSSFLDKISGWTKGVTHAMTMIASHAGYAVGHAIAGVVHTVFNTAKTVGHAITGMTRFVSREIQRAFISIPDLIKYSLTDPHVPAIIGPSTEVLANSAGKTPVILIPGTFGTSASMLSYYNSLEKAGIPTYSLTLGTEGPSLLGLIEPGLGQTAPIESMATELSKDIDKIQAETKSPKVDLVVWSQGGMIAKDYMTHDPKNNIRAVVGLAGDPNGATLSGFGDLLDKLPTGLQNVINGAMAAVLGPSFPQDFTGSPLAKELASYPDTKAGVNYLGIASKDDLQATPYQGSFFKPVPGADVTNIEVHSIPGVTQIFDHIQYGYDPNVIKYVTQYIENKGEPAPAATIAKTVPEHTAPIAPQVDLIH